MGELTVAVAALALTAGRYYLSAAAYPYPDPPYWRSPSDFHEQLYEFQVVSAHEIHGDVVMPSQWRHLPPGAAAPRQSAPQSSSVAPTAEPSSVTRSLRSTLDKEQTEVRSR